MINQANTILKSIFGFDEFRESQEAIISNVLEQSEYSELLCPRVAVNPCATRSQVQCLMV